MRFEKDISKIADLKKDILCRLLFKSALLRSALTGNVAVQIFRVKKRGTKQLKESHKKSDTTALDERNRLMKEIHRQAETLDVTDQVAGNVYSDSNFAMKCKDRRYYLRIDRLQHTLH